jgi:chromosome transmission fidelity protein 4
MLFHAKKRVLIKENGNLPLSPRSYLAWAGFSDEGSLCTTDSQGIVRLSPTTAKGIWYPVLNLREKLSKSSPDHYFVVGVSETGENARCLFCKGSRFPLAMPLPTLTLMPFKLPLCGMDADGGSERVPMEETHWRQSMLVDCYNNLVAQNFDVQRDKEAAEMAVRENAMKLFAVC